MSSSSSSSSSIAVKDVPMEVDPEELVRRSPWLQHIPYLQPGYIPKLKGIVEQLARSYDGDFCWASSFRPDFIAALMSHGFLTMATDTGNFRKDAGLAVMLPKLHQERCVLRFADMRVQRGTRKKAKHFKLTTNTAFDGVVTGLREQHGPECWFYAPLVQALRTILENPGDYDQWETCVSSDSTLSPVAVRVPVRVHSFEIWDAVTGDLAAGEIGCSVGSVYTSMSGFSRASSAGSVQMAATAALLVRRGCTLWDLGMELKYKIEMGAKSIPRRKFLDAIAEGKKPYLEHEKWRTVDDCGSSSLPESSGNMQQSAHSLEFHDFEKIGVSKRHSAHDIIKGFDPRALEASVSGGRRLRATPPEAESESESAVQTEAA